MPNITLLALMHSKPELAGLSLCRQVNGFSLLLDCGWDNACDLALLVPLLPQLPALDGVLISHPDLAHLGALPYLVRSPFQCPMLSLLRTGGCLKDGVRAATHNDAGCHHHSWTQCRFQSCRAAACEPAVSRSGSGCTTGAESCVSPLWATCAVLPPQRYGGGLYGLVCNMLAHKTGHLHDHGP